MDYKVPPIFNEAPLDAKPYGERFTCDECGHVYYETETDIHSLPNREMGTTHDMCDACFEKDQEKNGPICFSCLVHRVNDEDEMCLECAINAAEAEHGLRREGA